jgi:hypothetical protein
MEFDESSEEPLVSADTSNRTKFHPDESDPEQYAYWKRLAGYNSGVYNGYWTKQDEVRRLDNLAVYDAISCQLELTPRQKREGRALFDRLNVKEIGYSVETIAFCACLVAAERDGRTYSTRAKPENTDELFGKFADDLGLRPRIINRCVNIVREADDRVTER